MPRGGARPGGGRPKGSVAKANKDIKELAQSYGPAAIARLAQLSGFMVNEDGTPIEGSDSHAAQIAAIKELLDRGYGRSRQPLVGGDDDEDPIRVAMKVRFVRPS